MKHRIICALALVALVLALAFPVAVPAARPTPHAQPTPAAAAEKHHHIHDAIEALRAARGDLMEASHDFGGHREEAVRSIDASIHQLEICLQYDK
jgi:hypothetical protein